MNSVIEDVRRLTIAKNNIEAELTIALRKLKANSREISHSAVQIRLSYSGRCAELKRDPACCGFPPLEIHLAQCADPDSWVHSSFDKWMQEGLDEDFKTKTKK